MSTHADNHRRFSFSSRQWKSRLLALCMATTLLSPLDEAQAAATVNLAQEPLFSASTTSVYPNLMFLLDSSGSMGWDYVPDYVNAYWVTSGGEPSCFDSGSTTNNSIADARQNCYVGDPPFMSPEFNLIYYNADYTYQPGWNGTLATPAAYPAQTITGTTLDPYGQQKNTQLNNGNTGTTLDLTANYPDRRWCVKSGLAIDQTAAWIPVTSVTTSSTISALKVGTTNVLSGTTTAASTKATVAANLAARVLYAGYSMRYDTNATGFWLIGPAGTTGTPTVTVASGNAVLTPAAFGAACVANTAGYDYPNDTYRYLPGSGGTAASARSTGVPAATGNHALGAPYYWRVIPTEYCSDVAKTTCVDWTAANAVVSGTTYSTSKYCADTARTFASCLTTQDSAHRYPAKCSASACVEPGQGGTYIYAAPTRFCKPDTTNPQTDPLINCQGAYNSVTGHVVPKFLGYVIPAAGDNAYGLITIGSVIPGQQITGITITGSATNLLTSTYTVPIGATPSSVATALSAAISAGYLLDGVRAITRTAQGNVVRISSAVIGTLDNDKVITVTGPAWVTNGSPATATITVGSGAAGAFDYRLGPVCVGTVAGTFPTQTCSGSIISNNTDALAVDLSTPGGLASAATSIANSINNAAIAGYTATAATAVVTITAGTAGVNTTPVNIMASSLGAGFAAGTISVYGTTVGTLPYIVNSIAAGATTISTGAVNGSWDLTTSGGQASAATAIAAVIGNGYSATSSGGVVTITANTAGTAGNGALAVTSTGTAAAGSITVSTGSAGVRNYSISSITVGSTTVASNIGIQADTSTSAGRNAAATAIKNAIGNGYVGSCTGGATCTVSTVIVTATTPGAVGNGAIAVTSASVLAPTTRTLTVSNGGTSTDVSRISMSGCTDSTLNKTIGFGILAGDPAASTLTATVAGNIRAKTPVAAGLVMGGSLSTVTFAPAAGYGSRLNGCTLAVVATGGMIFTFTPSNAFTARDAFATTKVDVAGGKEAVPTTLSGISGGTNLLALPYTATAFAGGVNATGPVTTTTENFTGGSDAGSERRADIGSFKRCDITSTADCAGLGAGRFPRTATRTDCTASTGWCTYDEEKVNFANWYAFNRTRMQAMKTGAGLAFSGIGSTYRVGFSSIQTDSTGDTDFLAVSDFSTAQKQSWYTKFYAKLPSSGTPLRSALARIGQMFAHKGDLAGGDPVQYSCQQNFVLMTTDGYWNTDACGYVNQVDNATDIGQQDGAPTLTQLQVANEMWDGDLGGACLNSSDGPSSTATLADVAYYYAHTDLRTSTLANCANGLLGAAQDVCKNNVPHVNASEPVYQHMSTFTLGLGVSGTLRYQSDYDTAGSGDFYDIKHKTKKWPQVTAGSQTTVDDLWHAAVNGFGKYFSASNPTILKQNLDDALSTIKSSVGSGAAAATSAQALTTQTQNYAYVASYQTVYWYGNLEARAINATTAQVSPSATWCITDVLADLSTGATACAGKLKTQVAASTDTRNIYLFDSVNAFGNQLRSFTHGNLTAAEQAYFNPCTPTAPLTALSQCGLYSLATMTGTTATSLVNYLRGQTGQELDSSTSSIESFRSRKHPMGDAVGSQPVYVGLPSGIYNDDWYSAFKAAIAVLHPVATGGFPETVFIGANDGMLHAFNANDGTERWAYIPTPMLSKLRILADDNYSQANQHRFFVNASPVVADVCFHPCNSADNWHTILVGGYGAGGKGYFAIDITNPTQPVGLWEFGSDNDPDVGYSYGIPIITKRPDGRWVVLVTSGYENTSGTGEGVLLALAPDTGEVLTKISNNSGTTLSPSGLAKIEPFITDAVHDNTTRDVYGGDLDGNLWRFRLDVGTESVVKIAQFAGPTGTPQPITTKPILTSLDDTARTRYMIVGTGMLLQTADMTNTSAQSVYAFAESYDTACAADGTLPVTSNCDNAPRGTVIDSVSTRGSSSVVPSTTATVGHCAGASATSPPLPVACPNGAREQLLGTNLVPNGTDALGRDLRTTSSTTIAAPRTPVIAGCYVNLPDTGERVNIEPLIINGKIVVATNVPESSACSTGGHSYENVFDYKTCKADLSVELGSALVVGITIVHTAGSGGSSSGEYVPLITLANNPTPEAGLAVPQPSVAYQGRRLGWRLIND
ncbi:MAG: PilC/PilY family type IV pilus protein [Sulfurisoma sp.]|nr:PilC/PilY family type IV pilus protein [Sulfurisoma sp.]